MQFIIIMRLINLTGLSKLMLLFRHSIFAVLIDTILFCNLKMSRQYVCAHEGMLA